MHGLSQVSFPEAVSLIFLVCASVGCALVVLQTAMIVRSIRRPAAVPKATPGISILKPLCGIDDELEENLHAFAALNYPTYEVLLGVRKTTNPAYPVAQAAVAKWPNRFRLFIQEGEPGLNPKVNQLITLTKYAKHDILLVSDSNVRVPDGYLSETAAAFENPQVAILTHPIAGIGEKKLGSLLDNFYMTTHFSAGQIAAKMFADQDLVIGKSMGLRKSALEAMGGFASAKDVLAEDYVMGRRVKNVLKMKVEVGRSPVLNVSENRTVGDFLARYNRWGVMQLKAVGFGVYASQLLMYPMFLAAIGLLAWPTAMTLKWFAAVALLKITLDMLQGRMLRPGGFPWFMALCIPLLDMLVGWTWIHGLLHDRVEWRGNVLEVGEGTQLIPIVPIAPAPETQVAKAQKDVEEPVPS